MVHEKVDGFTIHQYPIIVRLLKEGFHNRPPLPIYTSIWKVQTVSDLLASMRNSAHRSLKYLTLKTAMFLALTRHCKTADLSQLDLNWHHYQPDEVTLLPSGFAKQSRQVKPIREFIFPSFPGNKNVYLVETLRLHVYKRND